MAKAIVRIDSIHKTQDFAAKMDHNYRLKEVKNADPERKDMNRSLIDLPEGKDYNSFFRDRVASLPYYETHDLRKNGVRGFEVMFAYGMDDLPEEFDLDRWAELSKDFLISEFGEENIASAVLHLDEGNPHIHAVVIPVKDGRISGNAFFPDRQSLRDFHTRYAEAVSELGLERGSHYTSISHEKVGKFYAEVDEAMRQKLPERKEEESIDDYLDRLNSFYEEEAVKNKVQEHQIKQLKKEKRSLEKANKTMSKMLDEKNVMISEQSEEIKEARHKADFYDGIRDALGNAERSENEEDRKFAEDFIEEMQKLDKKYNTRNKELTDEEIR